MTDEIFISWLTIGFWTAVLICWRVPLKTRFYFLLTFLLILSLWKAIYLSDYRPYHWFFPAVSFACLASAAWIVTQRQNVKP